MLTLCARYGRIVSYKISGVRGNYYVLPEWLLPGESLLPEYENRTFIYAEPHKTNAYGN